MQPTQSDSVYELALFRRDWKAVTRRTLASLALCWTISAFSAFGYVITYPPAVWPDGTIPMDLFPLPPYTAGLIDGSPSWRSVAENALATWNLYLNKVQFTIYTQSPGPVADGDRINQVFFSSTVYGQSFGPGVLAVTTSWHAGTTRTEGDTIFNSALSWNSYRGNLLPAAGGGTLYDFQRVAEHEFGHTLGLDHPDQCVIIFVDLIFWIYCDLYILV